MARPFARGKALYDFAGNVQLRQLTFKVGDMINITNQYDNGWWAGELNGKVGYLPSTYVEIIQNIGGTPSVVPTARSATLTAATAGKPAPTPGSAAPSSATGARSGPGTMTSPATNSNNAQPVTNTNTVPSRVPPATPPTRSPPSPPLSHKNVWTKIFFAPLLCKGLHGRGRSTSIR
ncbi:SH3 domain-containing protein [Nostoc sp. LEGE 12447]|uniref:SH3 domain-containing protein n=1 Tax=Nostoc sp. LEGE 12447 TaxID=1828640 RepID=UPI001D138481